MSYFNELHEKGISHYEMQQGEKIIRHLERGEHERAKSRLLSFHEDVGTRRSLEFLKNISSRTEVWGSFHKLLLSFLGTPELFGVDLQPETFIDSLIASEPKSIKELPALTYDVIESIIKNQLERNDAYFINIDPLADTFLAHLVPDILELRNRLSQEAKVRRISGDALDISDLFRSPHALRLLLTAGFGARITEEQVPQVDALLGQIDYPIRIVGNIDSSLSPFSSKSSSEIYKALFQTVSPRRKEYLVNLLYSTDWNEELQLDGLKYIAKVGHHFSVGPLLNALDSKSSLIVAEGAKGLGLLQVKTAIPLLKKLQKRNEAEIKHAATIALARLGVGRTSRALKRIIDSAAEEEKIKIEAALALANLKTKKSGEMLRELLLDMELIDLFRISGEIAYSGNVNVVPGFARLLFPQFDGSPQLRLMGILQRTKDGSKYDIDDIYSKFKNMGVTALSRLGSKSVMPIAAILQVLLHDEENEITSLVAEIASPDTKHPAISITEDIFHNMIGEKYRIYHKPAHMDWSVEDMVKEMIRALGLSGAKESIEILKAFAASDEKEIAMQAIEGLSEIDVPALNALMNLKQSSDPEIRRHHTLHVGSIFDERSIDWLSKQLEDKEVTVRITAAMSLLLQKSKNAIAPLRDFIEKADKPTRLILGSGIARLNSPIHEPLVNQLYAYNDPDIKRAIRAGKMTKMSPKDNEFWA